MPNKVKIVEKQLLTYIKRGDFSRGVSLPPERALAKEFGISYMTVRKAISFLVDREYLEKRHGIGIFVREDLSKEKLDLQLGLILPTWEAPEFSDTIIHVNRIAAENNWLVNVLYCKYWTDRIIDEAMQRNSAVIINAPGSLDNLSESQRKKLAAGKIPCVVINRDTKKLGLDSVHGLSALPLAIKKLHDAGHKKIALAVQKFKRQEKIDPTTAYIESWKKLTGKNGSTELPEKLLVQVNVPYFDLPHNYFRKLIIDIYKQKRRLPFTAIIVPVSVVWGIVRGVKDLGLKIPKDLSIIVIGDRQEAEFYSPKFDMIKVSLAEQVTKAWEIIQAHLKNKKTGVWQKKVIPKIIAGETIKSIN